MPCKTDLSALAAVAPTHIINPNKWKLGSPYKIEKWNSEYFHN